jgi:uncharacterized protein (DUF1697 family)
MAPGTNRTWIALLRGINLGARNKVAMSDLRALFSDLPAEDVTTYVQSGNVLFRSPGARDDLTQAIEREIRSRFGLDVTVLLRTKDELAAVAAGNPFAADEPDPRKLHATFLAERPEPGRVSALDEKQFEPDRFDVTRDVVYLHCPDGYGRSKLSNAFFEKQLGVAATTRNWRTVTALVELANA